MSSDLQNPDMTSSVELSRQCVQARTDHEDACELYRQAEHHFIVIADKNDTESPEYLDALKAFGTAWQTRRVTERCLCVLSQWWLAAIQGEQGTKLINIP